MSKKKDKKQNSNNGGNSRHAAAKAAIAARQAAKKAAKRKELKARGIDPDQKKRHCKRRRKASALDNITDNSDIVCIINGANIVVDGSDDVALKIDENGVRRWTTVEV